MPTHDPRMAMENLRDHLALHDKPIAFFLGAGASYAVTRLSPGEKDPRKAEHLIPAVEGLTKICANAVESLGDSYKNAWSSFVKECKVDGEDPNIENILSRVHLKLTAIGKGDQLAGLDKNALKNVDKTIRNSIAKAVQPKEEDIPLDLPHADLARCKEKRVKPTHLTKLPLSLLIVVGDILCSSCQAKN